MSKSKKSIKFYYGIPHAHTSLSTGSGSPEDAYYYAYKNGLDFLAITDHNNHLAKEDPKSSVSKWSLLNSICHKFNKKYSNFLAIKGFETKTIYGDINVINPYNYFKGTVNNFNFLVLWILNNPDSVICINHPHKDILNLEFNELLNKVITSIEVGNGIYPVKYVRYDKYYYSLLDKGFKLGAINGQDNHKLNFGDFENLTVLICNELSFENLINSFRERKTYSTESKTMRMYFSIDDIFMGGTLKTSKSRLRFNIYAEDLRFKINTIEIVSNKNLIVKKISDIELNSIKYIYEHEKKSCENWYVIRILSDNCKRLSISSPIFIEN